jgi:TRAP-type uncharacterized transport system substrate-binding protein
LILTGGTSGVYYPLGLALQKIFERDLPNSKVSVISTQATVENLNLLQQGKRSAGSGARGHSDGRVEGKSGGRVPELSHQNSPNRRCLSQLYPHHRAA